MRKIVVALAASLWLVPPVARAQSGVEPFLRSAPSGPPESGVSLSLRVGYAFPIGALSGAAGDDLSKLISGMIPLQVDVGWRFNPRWYAGGFFQYGLTMLGSEFKGTSGCDTNGVDCSSSDLRFGAEVVYTILPDAVFAPWVGIGAGYELLKFSFTKAGQSVDTTLRGWEFLRVSVGADYRFVPWFRAGPFVGFSLGQYQTTDSNFDPNTQTIGPNKSFDIANKALHEWLQLGIKGTFDL